MHERITGRVLRRVTGPGAGSSGYESVETTQIYVHTDLRLKEQALARMTAPASKPGRYRPDDDLLAFLESL
jgi:integrase/recombinase XerD